MKDIFFLRSADSWPASANITVIKDKDGLILFDVGCGLQRNVKILLEKLNMEKLNIRDVHTIVISHAHADHMGAIEEIYPMLQQHKVKILINKLEKEIGLNISLLNHTFEMELIESHLALAVDDKYADFTKVNKFFERMCPMSALPKNAAIDIIHDGETLKLGNYEFEVIVTPGHSPGHTSFYEINRKFLLPGDLVGDAASVWYSPRSGGVVEYLNSLEKINTRKIEHAFPSHGHSFSNIGERINDVRKIINQRNDHILEFIKQGPCTVLDLTEKLFDIKYYRILPGIMIVESHLQKLEEENKISRKEGFIFYTNHTPQIFC